MSKMFPFVTGILNPLCGQCDFNCEYCWSKIIAELYNMKKYKGTIRIDEKLWKHPKIKGREIRDDDYIFFVDMLDFFGYSVPATMFLRILDIPKRYPKTKFLLLTKNPSRFLTLINEIPSNCTLGATIESNRYYPTISKAPSQPQRIDAMIKLRVQIDDLKLDNPLFVCLEPILDFDFGFFDDLKKIRPDGIAIGYDNYNNKLPEPPLKKTEELLSLLEKFPNSIFPIPIYKKTIRRAWYEINETNVYTEVLKKLKVIPWKEET